MKTRYRAFVALVTCALLAPTAAHAAPVTVDLRVEGRTATHFEGKVTTDIRTLSLTGGPAGILCDGTAAASGSSPTPVPTSGAALATAIDAGLKVTGFQSDSGPTFETVSDENVSWDNATSSYLAEFHNGKSAGLGACAQPIVTGDSVLFAYGSFDDIALGLSVPAIVAPGQTATVKVTNLADGSAVAGAAVGGKVTGTDGTAVVGPFHTRGEQAAFKAAKPGAIRSNAGRICVTDGADGACNTVAPTTVPACEHHSNDGRCGTTDQTPPSVLLQGIPHNAQFSRSKAPTELRGVVGNFPFGTAGRRLADASGIKDIRLRITRYHGKNCWVLKGDTTERFVKLKKCSRGSGSWFSAGDQAEWSYQLPSRLQRGKYRIESAAIDGKGNAARRQVSTVNHIVFRVR